MFYISNPEEANRLLSALAEQLAAAGCTYEMVIVGGTALLAQGLTSRATEDVDLVARRLPDGSLVTAEPLPEPLVEARDRVAHDFGVSVNWLNSGPTGLLELGLPEGFADRTRTVRFGSSLTVHYASRLDLIHFKLYALVDQGRGKHEQDLLALEPTEDELVRSARWALTHDPSPGFKSMLKSALEHLGVRDADLND